MGYQNGVIFPDQNSDGASHVAIDALEGSKKYFVSHDFSNKNTWWQNSTREEDDALTDSGDHLTYTSGNANWIETDEISDRADLVAQSAADCLDLDDKSNRSIVVKVDASPVTTGFTIDHDAGSVTFESSQEGSTVTATYSYAGGSTYRIKPQTGKKLKLSYVEIQTSAGATMPAGGYVFQYKLALAGVVKERKYLNAKDLINFGTVGTTIPAFGELTKNVVILPFNYMTCDIIEPHPTYGAMWIETFTQDDGVVTDSELATVTYYCTSEDIAT